MSHLLEHARLGLPLDAALPPQPDDPAWANAPMPPAGMPGMPVSVTTATLRQLAMSMLADVERGARERAECRSITEGRLADMLTETEHVVGLMRACKDAGDTKAAGAIHAAMTAAQAVVIGYAHRAAAAPIARCEED